MSGFAADWLGLREPVDQRSRNAAILSAIEEYFHGRESITAIDLASGRGSMIRALIPRLPPRQLWYAVDDEAALLRDAHGDSAGSVRIEPRVADLAVALEDVISLPADLVVTSAFVDLVSDAWLDRLVRAAAAKSVPVYLGLSYDGRSACEPSHPLDAAVIAAFGRHQQRDKGFGPALGPAAGVAAAAKFAAAGYLVRSEQADWHVETNERALQGMMVAGWFAAVQELNEMEAGALEDWQAHRFAWIADGESRLMVGHLDIWATPP